MAQIGFKIDARPAEDVIALSRAVEEHGFDQLWFCEDLGLAGGIAQVSAALAVTETLAVGLGIAPAAVRNPVYLAMEFAALDRLSHGRLRAGIGHGEPRWLRQVGQHPQSLMTCLAEVSESVRDLLSGQRVTFHGNLVDLDDVSLTHPPATRPPLSLGVRGPRGIELARNLGLGVILAEGSTPDYVAGVRRVLGPDLPITLFTWCSVDVDDPAAGLERIQPTVEAALRKPSLSHQLGDGFETAAEATPYLSVAGDAEACRDALHRLVDAGADHVVLQPVHGREEEQIALFGKYLVPEFSTTAAEKSV
jgi:alkanesulfonate monooxygenase SsuD/methylene tetrahydromethanopterin reductase-like flavin-dependent oxidoreductase (luciferase family)